MPRSKLGEDALDHYLSLGPDRSYQAVADHYGVTKRTVARRAAAEGWAEAVAEASQRAREGAVSALEEVHGRQLSRLSELHQAMHEVMTPQRMKAVVASLFKAAVKRDDVGAARLLLDRVLGKVRAEPLSALALDLPDGLEQASDVRRAANALLQSIAEGSLAPEDAQRAAVVIESARKSIETEELETRLREIERQLERRGG